MDFSVNEDLSGYSPAEIEDLITAGNDALDALLAIDDPSDDDVVEAERIFAEVTRLTAERDTRATAAADRVSRMTALRDSRTEASADDEEPEPDEAVEEEVLEGQIVEEAVVASTRAPVTTSPRAALAGRRPAKPAKPVNEPIQITAAADIRGFSAGQEIADMEMLGEAVVNRMHAFPEPVGQRDGVMTNYGVASFRKQFPEDLQVGRGNDMEVLSRAGDQSRLPGKSLVAAGGWCAPSETLYDFCFNATPEGLVSVPEIQAARGGVRFTTGPDFTTIYNNTGFTQTEAQAIAGTAKSCYEVTCPTFTEVRLDVVGLCIKVPILTNAGYPEVVQSTISQALLAHQHRVSAYTINKMVTAAGAAQVPTVVGGAAVNALDGLEFIVQGIRQDYRLSFTAPVEAVAPFWLKGAIRADLANRTGVDLLNVSDSQIEGYLSARGINAQWVYNWQALDSTQEGYPTTAQVLVYPAGTFVKATTDVINLSAVYDAASLNVNTYTGLFMEEGIAVFKRCFGAKLITLNVCASGVTGAANVTNCFTLTP